MNYFDIFIVCLILLGSYRGFSKGLINELSSVFALILGVYGSLKFSDLTLTFVNINFAAQLESINDSYLKIFSFAFTFVIIIFSVSLLAKLLTKIAKVMFLGFVNKLLGGVFGGVKYVLIISFCLVFFENINSEFSVVDQTALEKLIFYNPTLEIGEYLLNIIDYSKNSINFFD